jgi:hypothetical protein
MDEIRDNVTERGEMSLGVFGSRVVAGMDGFGSKLSLSSSPFTLRSCSSSSSLASTGKNAFEHTMVVEYVTFPMTVIPAAAKGTQCLGKCG